MSSFVSFCFHMVSFLLYCVEIMIRRHIIGASRRYRLQNTLSLLPSNGFLRVSLNSSIFPSDNSAAYHFSKRSYCNETTDTPNRFTPQNYPPPSLPTDISTSTTPPNDIEVTPTASQTSEELTGPPATSDVPLYPLKQRIRDLERTKQYHKICHVYITNR